jgi:CRISPR/Cas system-associated exonuclease Cas4 (RecB family)
VENAVEGLIFEGRLGRDKAKSIAKMIKQRVDDEKVREWFDGSWTLYNECNIIVSPDKTKTRNRRPDRVMTRGEEAVVVDFKFASNKYEKDYKLQVSEYMSYLRDLGYKQVEGYIWYVYRNEVVSI